MLIDLENHRAARDRVATGIVHPERWRTARTSGAAALLARVGLLPPARALITIGEREPGRPALVAAAERASGLAFDGWVMSVSLGSVIRRNALLLFSAGSSVPRHVLKFARAREGASAAFDRDERGAALMAAAGEIASERAPRYLGRFCVGEYEASLETAAVGTKLSYLLRRPGSRRGRSFASSSRSRSGSSSWDGRRPPHLPS